MDQIFVINTVQAAAADLSTPGQGKVLVTGDTKGFIRGDVDSITVLPHKAETAKRVLVAPVAISANTEYSFRLVQTIDGVQVIRPVHYKTGSSAPSAGNFAIALAAAAQAVVDEGQLNVVVTVSTNDVLITGGAGNPLFDAIQPTGLTITADPATETATVTPTHSGGVLTITVAASSAYTVGETIRFSGWAGTAVINGYTAAQGVDLRVASKPTGTTITAFITLTSGSFGSGNQDISVYPQEAAGTAAVLEQRAITGGGNPNVNIDNTEVYHEVVVSGGQKAGQSKQQKDLAPIVKRYFIADSASIANANALLVRFKQVNNWLAAGGSFDPLLLN